MYASGDLFTCTAAHMQKSGKSPPPATTAPTGAKAEVAMTAVAVVVVAMVAVAAAAAVAEAAPVVAAAAAVGTAVTTIWHLVHWVKAMHILCSTIAVADNAEQDSVNDWSSIDITQVVIVPQLGGCGGQWRGNDAARLTIVLACGCRC